MIRKKPKFPNTESFRDTSPFDVGYIPLTNKKNGQKTCFQHPHDPSVHAEFFLDARQRLMCMWWRRKADQEREILCARAASKNEINKLRLINNLYNGQILAIFSDIGTEK